MTPLPDDLKLSAAYTKYLPTEAPTWEALDEIILTSITHASINSWWNEFSITWRFLKTDCGIFVNNNAIEPYIYKWLPRDWIDNAWLCIQISYLRLEASKKVKQKSGYFCPTAPYTFDAISLKMNYSHRHPAQNLELRTPDVGWTQFTNDVRTAVETLRVYQTLVNGRIPSATDPEFLYYVELVEYLNARGYPDPMIVERFLPGAIGFLIADGVKNPIGLHVLKPIHPWIFSHSDIWA